MTSNWPATTATVASLNDVGDVNAPTPSDDDILRYDTASGEWVNEALDLSALDDVDTTGIADDDILRYDTATSEFKPEALNLSALDDALITTPADRDILEYDNATSQFKNYANPKVVTGEETGFPNRTDTTLAASVSAGAGGTVTLAKVGASFDIWTSGRKITKTADEVFTVPATTGLYFCKYDSSGVPSISTSPWSLLTDIPVALFFYNDTTGDYFLGEERHGMTMDAATHYRLHFGDGAVWYSGFAVSGYTLNSDTLADVQVAIDSGFFGDEDITINPSAKAKGDNWDKWYRSGASGPFQKTTATDTIPAFHASNVPKINQDTGGGTWDLVSVTPNYYFNVFVFVTNSYEAVNRFVIIPGQSDFSSASAAELEGFTSLDLGTLPTAELIPAYRFKLQYKTSYTGNDARIEIIDVDNFLGSTNPSVAAAVTTHNSLGGRSDPGAHPSAAIATNDATLAGQLASATETDLKLALERLDDFGYVSAWATALAYRVGNAVKVDHKLFRCETAHTAAASFYTDLAAGYWSLIGEGGLAGYVQTTDATTTTIASSVVPTDIACSVQIKVSAFEPSTGVSRAWSLLYHLKNDSGVCAVTLFGESGNEETGSESWTAIADVSGTTFRIRVTGEAGKTINWNAICEHSYF